MPMQLEPSQFTEEECQMILDVVGRDFRLRNKDKIRIQALENEIEHIRTRRNLLTCNTNFNNTRCLNCFSTFIPIFIPRIRCPICGFNFCRKCFGEKESNETLLICPSCSKERDFLRKKNSWFYNRVETKFEKHCIAEIIKILQDKNLFRTKAEKDCFNGDSQQSLTGSSLNDNYDVHSNYKELMDMTLDKVKQAFNGNSVNFGNIDSTKNKEILVVQRSVISLLLFSLLQEIRGKSENINHHNVDIERTMEQSDVRVIEDFLTHALNKDKFNINPNGMRTYDYLEQLSGAIINQTINDVSLEENKSIRDSVRDRVTLAVLAKMSEEKNEIFRGDTNNNDSSQDARKQSQRSLMDEDETSPFLNDDDLESLRSFTESKSKEIPLPPVDLPLEYTKKLYGFESGEKIIGGRPLTFADPDLDVISMTSSPNVDSNFISPNIQSPHLSEDSWRIGERGSLIMRKRIPYGINDHYGTERKNDEGDDAVDGDDVKILDEVPDDQNLVMFLPDTSKRIFPTDKTKPLQTKSDKGRLESLNKGSIDDPDILENTNLTMFRRKKSLDNERLKVLSYTDDGNESSEAPRFVAEPEDSTATLGKPLILDCVVVGTKPIDITWYKHSKELVELNCLGDRYIIWQRGDNHRLEITSVTKEDHGYYMCMASNKAGFCQKGFRITVEKKDDGGVTRVQQQKTNVTRNSLNFQADHGLTEQDTTKGLPQPSSKLTTTYNDDDDVTSSSEKETFTPSISRESSFSNKHKKSSLTRRWLLGGVDNSDVKTKMDGDNDRKPLVANNEDKIKSLLHPDESQKIANNETKGENSAIERGEEIRESSNKNGLSPKSSSIQPKSISTSQSSKLNYCTDDERSGHGSQGDSLTSERPSFSEITDSRKVTLQDSAENFGKAPLSSNVDILQRHNKNLDLRENNLRYKIRSMSKSENNQRTMSSGEDVFSSEAGESSDLGEELITMPSVKELRKKFATDIVKDSRIRHIYSTTNQKNIEQKIPKVPVTDFQDRSYVPLSPVPINRDQKSLDFSLGQIHHAEDRGGLIRGDSSNLRQASGVKGEFTDESTGTRSNIFVGNSTSKTEGFRVENERIARYDPNIIHYQTNQLETNNRSNNLPSHRYVYATGPEIVRSSQSLSQSPMYNKPEDRSTIGQKRKEGRSISASRLPTGSFISKVVIGSDCDIVSSCSDLATI